LPPRNILTSVLREGFGSKKLPPQAKERGAQNSGKLTRMSCNKDNRCYIYNESKTEGDADT
jgi:hypothetical protein